MKCPVCDSPVSPEFRYCSQCGGDLASGAREGMNGTAPGRGSSRDSSASSETLEHKSRFRSYVDHSPHGVFIANERGQYLEVNPAACRITGYDSLELTRLSIADMLPREAQEEGLAAFAQLLKLGSFEGDFPFVKKCGERGWWSVSAVKLSENRLLGMVADITSRKQLEDSLLRTRARLQFLIRSSPAVIYTCEPSGDFGATFVSDTIINQLGYSPEEFIARKNFRVDRLHPEDRDRILAGLQHILEPGRHSHEYRFRHKNGSWRWMRDDFMLVRDAEGRACEIVGAWYDVTDQKHVESRLRASEERYRIFVEHATDAFFLHGKDGVICDVNTRACESLGYTREELIGKLVSQFDPCVTPESMDGIGERLARGETIAFETRHQRQDGSTFPVEVRLRGFESHGEMFAMSLVHDITQRVESDAALRESEERLRLALASANQGLWDLDVNTGETFVTPEYATMLGYDPGEFVETCERFRARLHPEDVAATAKAYDAYLSGERPEYRVEFRQKTRTGEWKWLLSCGKIAAWSDNGLPLRIIGTHTDITTLKDTESALRLNNAAIEASLNGVAIAGLDGRISYVNPSFLKMWGYARDDEVLGRSPTEFWTQPEAAAAIMQLLLEKDHWFGELTALRQDGSTFEVQLSSALIRDSDGKATHMMGSFIDVTQSKQQREALERSQTRLADAQRIAKIGSWELDLVKNRLNWSDEIFRMFGVEKESFGASYESFLNAIHPDDRQRVDEAYTRSLVTRQPYQISHRMKHADGTVKWVTERGISFFDGDGRPVRSIGTVQDVTEQKQAEEKMATLRDELAHVHRLGVMGELASGLAHELNQPLSALALYAGTAQLLAMHEESSELRSILAKIGEQSLRAGDIIRGMRSFVNRDRSTQSAASLNQLIHDALDILEYDLKHQMIGVTLQLDEQLPEIIANRIQILQVLVNLIRNSIEAMSDAPEPARSLTLRTERADGGVRVTITDTGCGYDAAAARTLFHPFQSSKPIGMGMGLAISRKLIEAHNGRIDARSVPGAGASFDFWLPAAQTASDIQPAHEEGSS
ncbi:MAG: PAS domain S-box protein [Planctomycetaceae bacterium]